MNKTKENNKSLGILKIDGKVFAICKPITFRIEHQKKALIDIPKKD